MTTTAAGSGTFKIGGDLEVTRLGFGAMRIVGKGIWGPPADRDEVLAVLRRLPELGIDFIDTADAYGPLISEQLIHEALHPYDAVTVATKVGQTRQGPNRWVPIGRPDYLRQQAELSLRHLGVEAIDLFQLHKPDPTLPWEDAVGTFRDLRDEGKVRHVGLSNVTIEQIEAARRIVPIVTVQNQYNLIDRKDEDVLEYCEREGIGFIPWNTLAIGKLNRPGGIADEIATAHDATPGQVALAWLLQRSPVMLPIPGTSTVAHLEDNVGAADLRLGDDEFARLDDAGKVAAG
jgi:pyridoxine 4-dehydrogenase